MPRPDLRVSEWLTCTWVRLRDWFEERRASTGELRARRERLIRAYASHAGLSGPALMGIGAQLAEVERELCRRHLDVDENDWMQDRGRQKR